MVAAPETTMVFEFMIRLEMYHSQAGASQRTSVAYFIFMICHLSFVGHNT